jgi:hypothetical protein
MGDFINPNFHNLQVEITFIHLLQHNIAHECDLKFL